MKVNRLYLLIGGAALICLSAVYVVQHKSYKVDFDASMRLSEYPDLLSKDTGYSDVYAEFKKIYEKNYVPDVPADAPYKIPKIVHQIWLGSPFPEKYMHYRDSWIKNHPDWEYKLWTEKEIDAFGLTNRAMYDHAVNYGEKSDIARYEILYRLGGVYVDTDFESYKPLDKVHQAYDFYIGIQPLDTGHVQLGIGIIGSRSKHPLLQVAITEIGKKQKIAEPVVLRTGPFFFTILFYHLAKKCTDSVIALPAGFFYPMGYHEKVNDSKNWLRPESLANHHWAGSWLSDDAFVK